MNPSLIAWIYGAIVAVVGVLGYVRAGSKVSAIAGLAAGAVLIALGVAMQRGQRWGLPAAVIVTILLLGNFASRYFRVQPREFWPNGVMAAVSLAALAALALSAVQRSRV